MSKSGEFRRNVACDRAILMRAIIMSRYPVTRSGLSSLMGDFLCRPEIEAAASLNEALVSAANRPIELLVIEADSGGPYLAEIKGAVDAVRPASVVLFALLPAAAVQAAYESGVKGYLPKTAPPELLAAGLKLVMAGGVYFSDFGEMMLKTPSEPRLRTRLSTRQLEVLRLIEIGQTNKEIAQALGISVATVKLHVQAILNVTGARNRTEAALRARGQFG